MFVKHYVTDEDYEIIAVCDVCGLPYQEGEDVIHSYHIHHDCYWSLEKIHAPGSKETLKSLGFKEYIE